MLWANVHLEPAAEGPHGFSHVPGAKTGAARRNVPLTPRAKTFLAMRRSAKVASWYAFPGPGQRGHMVTVQHARERCIDRVHTAARKQGMREMEPFKFYCWRHTCGTRWAEAGLDKCTVARLMRQSSARVAEGYYVHVTKPHVANGFERFVTYLERRLVDLGASVDGGRNRANLHV